MYGLPNSVCLVLVIPVSMLDYPAIVFVIVYDGRYLFI